MPVYLLPPPPWALPADAPRWACRLGRGLWPRNPGRHAHVAGAMVCAYRPINERSVWARPSGQIAGRSTFDWPAPCARVRTLVHA